MKILQITYSLGSGGAERLSVELSNELCRQGHQVYLCVVRDLAEEQNRFYLPELDSGVKVIELKIPRGFSFRYFFALSRAISSVSPDVVHTHLNIIRYIFPLRPFFPSVRFVHTIHSDAPKEVSSRIEFFANRIFFRRHWIQAVTISDETSRSFSAFYGIPPAFQINNGRSKLQRSARYGETMEYIRSLRRTPSTLVLLHVGRFAVEKNQHMLVRVVGRLIREGYDMQLVIVGEGYDTPEASALKDISPAAVHYVGGRLNVGDYYFAADAFCLSSVYEGMPLALIEAMCCGCIPVCTPVGGCRNLIKNGENGFLSRDCSDDAYHQALVDFIDHHSSVDKKALSDYFERHLSIERCAGRYLEAYWGG